jgi:hypothetical protein
MKFWGWGALGVSNLFILEDILTILLYIATTFCNGKHCSVH